MTLSLNRRNRSLMAASLAGSLASQYGPPAVRALGNYVGRSVASFLNGVEQSPGTNFTGMPNGTNRQFLTMGPSRSQRRRKIKRRKAPRKRSPGRQIIREQSVRSTFRDIVQIKNTSSGVLNQYYQIAITGTSGHDLGAIFTSSITGMKAVFQQVIFHSLTFTYLPALPYTVGGQMCLGIDGNTNNGVPGGYPIRHDPSVLGDVKENLSITWTPRTSLEALPKWTDATTNHSNDTCIAAVFQAYSINSQADTTTTIGSFVVEMDVTYCEFI
jgi:hypothetical protein